MKNNKAAQSVSSLKIVLKYCICVFAVFTLAAITLIFPSQSANGVRNGLELCFRTVIPSLFPFMVISSFLVQSNLTSKLDRISGRLTYFLFRQPSCTGSVIFLSLISGFPVGTELVRQLYDSKKITKSQGQRLLLFCVNPGPAFVISCVGVQILGSQKIGVILFASVTLSSVILGILTRFMVIPEDEAESVRITDNPRLSQSLVAAVSKSTNSVLMICGWVIVFSTISSLLQTAGLSEGFALFLDCILEVTNGCYRAVGTFPVSVVAGIISWSGFCVHCQVMPAIIKLRLNYKYFATGRIICGALACVICSFLLNIFCPDTAVIKLNYDNISAKKPEFLPVSLGLFAMCALFLIGDSVRIRLKSRHISQTAIEIK